LNTGDFKVQVKSQTRVAFTNARPENEEDFIACSQPRAIGEPGGVTEIDLAIIQIKKKQEIPTDAYIFPIPEKDIMDVWFDSGSTHQSVLVERGLPYPADLYLEGADQYRGWFQSSLLTSVAINGIAPYKQVLTHGWTIDKRRKEVPMK